MKTLCQFQVYDKMVIKERDTFKLTEISIFVLVTLKLSSFGNCHFTETHRDLRTKMYYGKMF